MGKELQMHQLAHWSATRPTRTARTTRLWVSLAQIAGLPVAYAAVSPSPAQAPWTTLLALIALTVLMLFWRSNQRLQRQGAMMTQLLDHTPTPLIVLDVEGRIQGWNRAAAELFGWSADAAMKELVATLLFEKPDQKSVGRLLSRLLQEGQNLEAELHNNTRGGSRLCCQWRFQVLEAQAGGAPLVLATVNDITEQKAAEQNWVRLASTDPLTGLANRRHFQEHCREALARSQRNGTPLSLLYLDLDDFKNVNDRYGHEAGDAVLARVAQRLQQCLRNGDLLARLGGDEFVVVLERAEMEQAQALAHRIHQSMSKPVVLPKGERVRQKVSIGLASHPQDGSDAEALIHAADQQMYQAKQNKLVPLVRAT
ncbi:sensor domain-containing diguanylate cyclase [Marinobacter hydrocarbonoclasticus]|nr:sensor domain-containing diguanylate cyclase [Marinobacter nauticus]